MACSITNCQQCSNQYQCQYCQVGYYLAQNSYQCLPVCTVSNCLVCLSPSLCKICINTYSLSIDGTCKLFCLVKNCEVCTNNQICTNCANGYLPTSNGLSCYQTCGPFSVSFNFSCLSCANLSPNCKNCVGISSTSVNCQSCTENAFLANGSCIVCSNFLPNCLSCKNSLYCDRCNAGFSHLQTNGIKCSRIISNCPINFCQSCTS